MNGAIQKFQLLFWSGKIINGFDLPVVPCKKGSNDYFVQPTKTTMKGLLLCGAAALTLAACSKTKTGSIKFSNTSRNPYTVYLDGVPQSSVPANDFKEVKGITVGTHTVKAKQESGFVTTPTERERDISVLADQQVEFAFP